jgi:hypothetical protein
MNKADDHITTTHATSNDLDAMPRIPLAPSLRREGLDLVLEWADKVQFTLAAIRDGRDGVRGELTVSQDGRRCVWGA